VAFKLANVMARVTVAALMLHTTPLTAQEAEPSRVDSGPPTDHQLESARVIAARAERLFDAGHFRVALAEYTRAYDALAGHPRQYFVLYNLAACNERLFQYDVALGFYEEYLRRAPETEPDRPQVVAIMSALRALLGTLVVESNGPTSIWVDDRRLGTAPGRWLLPAGRHVVEARAELRDSQQREVQVRAGQLLQLRFELERLSANTGPRPAYFWAATTLTGAALVTGTVFGALALSAREDGRERAEYFLDSQAEADRTRNYALAADVGFGSAALLGASAAVLYFITDWSSAAPSDAKRSASRGPTRFRLASSRGSAAALRVVF
jgi:tetratricopeptide (TPR) repeat protein